MAYEYFYPGTPYSLEPNYGSKPGAGITFTGYNANAGSLALTTDPRTANQLQDVSNKLNTGLKAIELSTVQAEVFESIPQQHFKEINRLSKLTGAETTLHAPIVEASGYSKEGWSEMNRRSAENQMNQILERASDLSKNGNVPVTFHSTAMLPEGEEKVMVKGEDGDRKEIVRGMIVVDPRNGSTHRIQYTKKFFPGEPEEFIPGEEVKRLNKNQWSQELGNINFSASRGEQEVEEFAKGIPDRMEKQGKSEKEIEEYQNSIFKRYAESRDNPESFRKLPEDMQKIGEHVFRRLDHASIFLKDSYRGMKEQFDRVYNDADPKDKAKLDEYIKWATPYIVDQKVSEKKEKLPEFAEVVQKGIKALSSIETPNIFKPLNTFVLEKSSETFGNAAFAAWTNHGDKAPIISIENPPAGGGISRAEDLKKLIEKSRERFSKVAVEKGVMSKSEADKAAKQLIGATWDVGHINMIRKYGYNDDDLVEETKTIAPFVKHVHLSDNFGNEHTELPMGMGNVPIKRELEKLEQAGFKGKKVIEAGNWWAQFRTPPVVQTLEALGSPLYPMLAQPSWNQMAATYGNYFAFPSAYMPEQHFSLYGGGFSGLPQELGGQMPGKQSRMTGTPMD